MANTIYTTFLSNASALWTSAIDVPGFHRLLVTHNVGSADSLTQALSVGGSQTASYWIQLSIDEGVNYLDWTDWAVAAVVSGKATVTDPLPVRTLARVGLKAGCAATLGSGFVRVDVSE